MMLSEANLKGEIKLLENKNQELDTKLKALQA